MDLAEEGVRALSLANAEQCLVSRLSLPQNANSDTGYRSLTSYSKDCTLFGKSLASYLVGCWNRLVERKRLSSRKNDDNSSECLQKISELLVAYFKLILQFPEMFPQPADVQQTGQAIVIPALNGSNGDENAVPHDLLDCLIVNSTEDEVRDIFGPILMKLSADMRQMTINSNYLSILLTVSYLTKFKVIAALIPKLPSWNPPNLTARSFEIATFLGPFFRLSVFGVDNPEFARGLFGEKHQRTHANVESIFSSYRLSLTNLWALLHQFTLAIVKSSPEYVSSRLLLLLAWFLIQ